MVQTGLKLAFLSLQFLIIFFQNKVMPPEIQFKIV